MGSNSSSVLGSTATPAQIIESEPSKPPIPAPPAPKILRVTQRERDVLNELVKDGALNEEIGKRLYVTGDTVKTHIKNIFKKTGINNRTTLALAIAREQIVVRVILPHAMTPAPESSQLATPRVGLQAPRLARTYASLGR